MYTMLNVQTGFVYKTSQYKDHSTQLIKTLHFLPKQFMLLFLNSEQTIMQKNSSYKLVLQKMLQFSTFCIIYGYFLY